MRPKAENVAKGMYWDSTFSPWIGCTPCSPGCDNCWARRQEDGRLRHLNRMQVEMACRDAIGGIMYDSSPEALKRIDPYFWRGPVYQGDAVLEKAKKMKGVVFAGFRTDLFHEGISDSDFQLAAAYMCDAIRSNGAVFLMLTKRAALMEPRLRDWNFHTGCRGKKLYLTGFRLGVTVCNQAEADAKLPHLKSLYERGAFTWASVEPMLGPIDLTAHLSYLRWVVVGGETGKGARPMDPDWARSVRDQCKAAGVPVWIKQMSKKGEIPADLMVRQWDETDLEKE